MVSILNKPIAAEDAFLYRPDANAPGSDRHPFRAVRLANDSGFTLEPGPIAIFARGTFVGDSLIGRLERRRDRVDPVRARRRHRRSPSAADATEKPVRIVSIHTGVLTVEEQRDRARPVTRSAPAASRRTQIYIRHAKTNGYLANDLPPGTLDRGRRTT